MVRVSRALSRGSFKVNGGSFVLFEEPDLLNGSGADRPPLVLVVRGNHKGENLPINRHIILAAR